MLRLIAHRDPDQREAPANNESLLLAAAPAPAPGSRQGVSWLALGQWADDPSKDLNSAVDLDDKAAIVGQGLIVLRCWRHIHNDECDTVYSNSKCYIVGKAFQWINAAAVTLSGY